MPYARFDDRYDDNEKMQAVWATEPAAVGLHAFAITYCNRHNTDGRISTTRIDLWLRALPYSGRQKTRVLTTVLDFKLLEPDISAGFYFVHDYLHWNRSSAEREALSQQGRRGGLAKAKATAKPRLEPPPSQGSSEGSSTPDNAKTTPLTSSREAEKHPEAARLSQRLAAHVCRNDPKASPHPESDSWVRDMRLLLQDRTGDIAEVERVIDWSQSDPFWHSNILSPAKLRKQFTQLLLRADGAQVVPMRKPSAGDLIAKLRAAEEAS